jgi:PST family polysaccharide transporter
LFKVTSLNSISIFIKILVGFVTSKVIAIFVGPSGMALVGNLRNFMSSLEAFSTLGFENGVVKYVSENKSDEAKLRITLSTVFFSVLVSCLIVSVSLFTFSEYFNAKIFGHLQYGYLIKSLILILPFYIGNIFLVAIINGLGKYRKVILINILGSLLGLFVTVILITQFQVSGALFSIVITPSLLFFVSFYFINKELKILKFISKKEVKFVALKNFSSFTIMALVSSVFGPLVLLSIRNHVIGSLGIDAAGYWEGLNRISSYYFLFITSILGIYFLPKLSNSKSVRETNSLIISYFKTVLPIFVSGLIVIFIFKDVIIQLLFTKDFSPMSTLFFWQIVGDILKAASYILAFQFYAKKMTKAFVLFEIASLAVLYFSSIYFISIYQIEGVVIAHAFTYVIYFVALVVYFRRNLFLKATS